MFVSANNQTFGARAREVLAHVAAMLLWMLLIVVFFRAVGFSDINNSNNTPLLGVIGNYFLHSHHFTLATMLASAFVVMGVLITCFGAPILEEIVFRGLVCGFVASDEHGKMRPAGIFAVLTGSFIFFGLVHGQGYFSIMLQGVLGLFLAHLWFRNGPNRWAAALSCMAAHSLYNISITVIETVYGS